MTLNIQIAVDCRNPHELADWWAETLDWAVEPQDEAFIRSMIEQGFATEAETTTHQRQSRVARRAPRSARPRNSTPKRPRAAFCSRLSRRKRPSRTGSIGTCGSRRGTRTRSAPPSKRRGATFLWTANQGPHSWHTMADPEGNEFCIS